MASPYREVTRPVLDYVKRISKEAPRTVVTVFIPEYVVGHWWEQLLHNQSALRLKTRLLFMNNVMVTSVPWQLTSSERVHELAGGSVLEAFLPGGRLAAIDPKGGVTVWDLAAGKVAAKGSSVKKPLGVRLDRARSRMVITAADGAFARRSSDGALTTLASGQGHYKALTFDEPGRQRLVIGQGQLAPALRGAGGSRVPAQCRRLAPVYTAGL